MSERIAVRLENVTKTYRLYDTHIDRVKEAFHPFRKKYHRPFNALENVSFEILKGETVGVIGRNGSGKSTLLQIICGIVKPNYGSVEVVGKISALLELGAGFNPEFSGRENVYLNGAILGLSPREIELRFNDIVNFAGIEDFIDQPVKTYSSGMYVRLAFAIAVNVEPDILVVDEALAVGDMYFQHKCMQRMRQLIKGGTTLLFVSHDLTAVKSLCSRAVLLRNGSVAAAGDAEEVVNTYYYQVIEEEKTHHIEAGDHSLEKDGWGDQADGERLSRQEKSVVFKKDEAFLKRAEGTRSGTGEVGIQNTELLDLSGESITCCGFQQVVVLRIHLAFFTACKGPNIGFLIRDRSGIEIIGTNLFVEEVYLSEKESGETAVVDFRFTNILQDGTYSISCAAGMSDEQGRYNVKTYDWVDNAVIFRSESSGKKHIHAKVYIPVEVELYE